MSERSIGKQITSIARSLSRYLDNRTSHLHLSSATIPFLTYLYEHNGVHQDEMARNLQFDKSSATRAIKTLEQRGYVSREIDKTNRRKNVVSVTRLGFSIKEELYAILRHTTTQIFQDFSANEKDAYFRYTDKVNENITQMINEQKQ